MVRIDLPASEGAEAAVGARITGVGDKSHGLVEWRGGFVSLDSDSASLVWIDATTVAATHGQATVVASRKVMWKVGGSCRRGREHCSQNSVRRPSWQRQVSQISLRLGDWGLVTAAQPRLTQHPLLRLRTRASSSRAWQWWMAWPTLACPSLRPAASERTRVWTASWRPLTSKLRSCCGRGR